MGWRITIILEFLFNNAMIPILRIIAPMFFDSRYLTGRHFSNDSLGWRWVRRSLFTQRFLSYNRHIPWPVSPFIMISDPRNIDFHPDDLNNFQHIGCYFQNFSAKIVIGRGTYIAPNVGIITANHDLNNLDAHLPGNDVVIGISCWIGMNSILLPGVHLGPHTIVGAGSVVTKSFAEGNVIIAGNPAKIIKSLST